VPNGPSRELTQSILIHILIEKRESMHIFQNYMSFMLDIYVRETLYHIRLIPIHLSIGWIWRVARPVPLDEQESPSSHSLPAPAPSTAVLLLPVCTADIPWHRPFLRRCPPLPEHWSSAASCPAPAVRCPMVAAAAPSASAHRRERDHSRRLHGRDPIPSTICEHLWLFLKFDNNLWTIWYIFL
jgi:hypothetical protein